MTNNSEHERRHVERQIGNAQWEELFESVPVLVIANTTEPAYPAHHHDHHDDHTDGREGEDEHGGTVPQCKLLDIMPALKGREGQLSLSNTMHVPESP